jgi:hypothetical protein
VSSLDVVWNPLDKVSRVLGLDVLHLIIDFPHRDLSTEVGGNLVIVTAALSADCDGVRESRL